MATKILQVKGNEFIVGAVPIQLPNIKNEYSKTE